MERAYGLDQGLSLRVLCPRERIESEVGRLAEEINAAYADKDPLVVVVLKGALFFAADLLRALRVPIQIDFVKLSSYQGMESSGKVLITKDLDMDASGRDLLVIEDIVDTGLSLSFLLEVLRGRGDRMRELPGDLPGSAKTTRRD